MNAKAETLQIDVPKYMQAVGLLQLTLNLAGNQSLPDTARIEQVS